MQNLNIQNTFSVVYSNDLNRVNLSSLSAQEQNLFFSIIVKLKDKGHEPVTFSFDELQKICKKNYSIEELTEIALNLKDHFFKIDFTQVFRDESGIDEEIEIVNLFKTMVIKKHKGVIESLTIEVNERFEYMLNELSANFTKFELANFLLLDSKYSKILFRLLKQYRTKGWAYFKWDEFVKLMGIDQTNYKRVPDIERNIIVPAVKELFWTQKDFFKFYNGIEKPYFEITVDEDGKELPPYEKIKKNPDKKTSPVVAIRFNFKPERVKKNYEDNLLEVITKPRAASGVPVAETGIPVAE